MRGRARADVRGVGDAELAADDDCAMTANATIVRTARDGRAR